MAAPARRETTDEAFLREQYGELDTYTKPVNQNGFGVQNSQMERRRVAASHPANRNRPPLRVVPKEQRAASQPPEYVERPTTIPAVPRKKPKPKVAEVVKEVSLSVFAYVRGVPNVLMALTWTIWTWLIQLVFAILGAVSLGLAFFLESYMNSLQEGSIFSQTLAAAVQQAGFEAEVFLFLFFLCTILIVAIGYLTMMVAFFQLKMGLLHPLWGKRGHFSKMGFFLLAFVGMWIPGVNFFPLIQFWLLAVMAHPR